MASVLRRNSCVCVKSKAWLFFLAYISCTYCYRHLVYSWSLHTYMHYIAFEIENEVRCGFINKKQINCYNWLVHLIRDCSAVFIYKRIFTLLFMIKWICRINNYFINLFMDWHFFLLLLVIYLCKIIGTFLWDHQSIFSICWFYMIW